MVKIIICTTFREFKGTENDKIQYMFLDNIKHQTYQNFQLVTTTFGEKKVKEIVDSYFGEKSTVFDVQLPKEYRFSLTDVVLNGIKVAEDCPEESIIIWCTCDVQFEPNFFEIIAQNYEVGISGIIHPNIIYNSVDDLISKKGYYGSLGRGIDLLFYDSKVLIKAKQDIINYRFYDWGVFEYFMVALALKYSSSRINLFCISPIHKIENNRKLTNETENYFRRCINMNGPVFLNYWNENFTHKESIDDLYYYHRQYEMLYPNVRYKLLVLKYNIEQLIFLIKKIIKYIIGWKKS